MSQPQKSWPCFELLQNRAQTLLASLYPSSSVEHQLAARATQDDGLHFGSAADSLLVGSEYASALPMSETPEKLRALEMAQNNLSQAGLTTHPTYTGSTCELNDNESQIHDFITMDAMHW